MVNKRRKLLGLPEISELKKDTDVSDGLAEGGIQGTGEQTKESALADLKALLDVAEKGLELSTKGAVASLLKDIAAVEADSTLLPLIKRHSFLQAGLDFVDGPHCPLCDKDWDTKALRVHLREKLEKSKEAQLVRDRLIESGRTVAAAIIRLRGLIDPLTKLPEVAKEFSTRLGQWSGGLLTFSESLGSLDGVIAAKSRLQSGWAVASKNLVGDLEAVQEKVKARPDKSAAAEAGSFLVVAQERLNNVRTARRNAEEKKANASLGKRPTKLTATFPRRRSPSSTRRLSRSSAHFTDS